MMYDLTENFVKNLESPRTLEPQLAAKTTSSPLFPNYSDNFTMSFIY